MQTGLLRLLVAGLLLAVATAPAASQPLPRPIDDTESNCTASSLFPGAAYVPLVDSGEEIVVDLFVVGDRGIDTLRMTEVVAQAQRAYKPLGMKLRVAGAQEVVFRGVDADGLIKQAKYLFPGAGRPTGIDAVLIFTSVDITSAGLSSAAGKADCVGGIAFPTKAFVVLEDDRVDAASKYGPVTMFGHTPAKIAAHELAHLFGAHHQYANCAEGIPSEAAESEASPCTVMFNDVGLVSLAFSALEGAVVRGYALQHLTS